MKVYVTDDGGTGVCGDDTSATASFTIVIRAQVGRTHPATAAELIRLAGKIVNCIACPQPAGDE